MYQECNRHLKDDGKSVRWINPVEYVMLYRPEKCPICKGTNRVPITLSETQFHVVWTAAVGRKGYNKGLFQDVFQLLKESGHITNAAG